MKYVFFLIGLFAIGHTHAIIVNTPDLDTQGKIVVEAFNEALDSTLKKNTQELSAKLSHTLQKAGIIGLGTSGGVIALIMLKDCVDQWKKQKEDKNIKARIQCGISLGLLATSVVAILMSSKMIDYWQSASIKI